MPVSAAPLLLFFVQRFGSRVNLHVHDDRAGLERLLSYCTRPAILGDRELERLLRHLGLPAELPRTKPARAPPLLALEDCQIDPSVDAREGIDEPTTMDWASA